MTSDGRYSGRHIHKGKVKVETFECMGGLYYIKYYLLIKVKDFYVNILIFK